MDDTVLNSRDDEEHPRVAGAIRTALMLGAEFEQHLDGRWSEKTINSVFYNRGILAFMFIGRHGLGIDEHGSPYFLYVLKNEDKQDVPHPKS